MPNGHGDYPTSGDYAWSAAKAAREDAHKIAVRMDEIEVSMRRILDAATNGKRRLEAARNEVVCRDAAMVIDEMISVLHDISFRPIGGGPVNRRF